MAIIHTHTPKRKAKKPNAKQRQLAADWDKLLEKYAPKKPVVAVKALPKSKPYIRETPHYPSLNTGFHDCTKKEKQTYTGSNLIGIGTLHKSNAVPVFSQDDAIEISRMRRG